MTRSRVRYAVAFASLLVACGGDDGSSSSADRSQEAAGSSGGKKEEGAACGPKVCTVPDGQTGDACCLDQFAGTCGVKSGAGTCHPPVSTDKRCPIPDLKLMLPSNGSIMQPLGCCTTDNECGVDFGIGCQSRTVLCSGIGLDQLDKLKRQTCDGNDLPLPADCGTMMVTLPNM
jgi:hypothetical protein